MYIARIQMSEDF